MHGALVQWCGAVQCSRGGRRVIPNILCFLRRPSWTGTDLSSHPPSTHFSSTFLQSLTSDISYHVRSFHHPHLPPCAFTFPIQVLSNIRTAPAPNMPHEILIFQSFNTSPIYQEKVPCLGYSQPDTLWKDYVVSY